jgi:two-component system, OmpR family, alkaline phosphatase synthesis response regulator PhoP
MKQKVLLVDDEKDIVEFLAYNLEAAGFEVAAAYDGEEALAKIDDKTDLIVLDIMMPKLDGFETCKRIRAMKNHERTPVIFLTAKASETDEVSGLEIGASDYVRKPISPKKLVARVKSNLRNVEAAPKRKKPRVIERGSLVIDRDKYSVTIAGVEKPFPRKEFELLYYLADNPGIVFNRETLLKDVWGGDVYVVDRTVDVHVRKIREKLGEHDGLIETVKGVGYRFKEIA